MYSNKYITLTLFICLLCTVCFLLIKWLFDIISKKINNSNVNNGNENFYNKRNTKIKIYKSDEISDPDEQLDFEDYDPDNSPMKFDLD